MSFFKKYGILLLDRESVSMSINNKKNIYYIISLILTLLIFVAASTFAYFSMVASREKDSTQIYTGTVMINYHQGDIIKIEKWSKYSSFGDIKEISFNALNIELPLPL